MSAKEPVPQSNRLEYIDALRGIAILLVAMIHTSQHGKPIQNESLFSLIGFGKYGVQLFFIVSAFTLYLTSAHNRYGTLGDWGKFYLKRVFRLAPLYYIGISAYILINGTGNNYWLGSEGQVTLSNVVANLLFLHGLNPYWMNSIVPGGWSITAEFMFYGLFPLVFRYVNNLNRAFVFFLATLIGSGLLNLYMSSHQLIPEVDIWHTYLYFWLPNQMPIFALGIILYHLIHIQKLKLTQSNLSFLLATSSLIIFIFITLWRGIIQDHIWAGLIFCNLFIVSSQYYQLLPKLLAKNLEFIGKISYGIYLSHFAVLKLLDEVNFANYFNISIVDLVIRYTLTLSLSVAIAYALHIAVEMPYHYAAGKLKMRKV